MSDSPGRRHPAALADRADMFAPLGADGITRPLSLAQLRGARLVSVRDLGAVGDGRSHPLAERFASLAAARRAFPRAESLQDELDWAATQAAIDLVAATGGGTVLSPAGQYRCNRTLTFPECREFGEPGVEVNWLGEGKFTTLYHWPQDLGEGAAAVLCPRRHEPDGMYEGLWQDIGLIGPGAAPAPGQSPARMDGWGWGARRRMVRCAASRFRAGLSLVGDHARFEDVVSRENYYAVHFPRPSRHLFGDLLFEKCMFSGCGMAAIAVHAEAQMGGCTLIACYLGGAPYGIMKEAGPGEAVMLAHSHFLNCMFEFIGNGWLQDRNAPLRALVREATFEASYFGWSDRYRWPGAPRAAAWQFHRAEHLRWSQPKEVFALRPGDAALIQVEVAVACEITGRLAPLLANCTAAGRPFLHPGVLNDAFRGWRLAEPGAWEGGFALLEAASPPVRPGEVLEWAPAGRVRRGSLSAAPVAGLCLLAAAPGGFTIMATSGPALTVRAPQGRADGWLAKGADGTAVPAATTSRANHLGWCFFMRDGEAVVALG